jgi:phosphoribosylglycinamide formyltransferase-1
MLRVGVLVSGSGTNLQAIIDKANEGFMPNCKIVCVVSSNEKAYALERARKHGITNVCFPRKDYPDNISFGRKILEYLKEQQVDIVVLAGFMYILSEDFINEYKNKIINVHPSLIPSFCGKGFYGLTPHIKALEYGVKVTGATVHFVDAGCDTGPIILQKAVYVKEDDTPETLQRRVMEEAEWEILPKALKLLSEGRVKVDGRRVIIN